MKSQKLIRFLGRQLLNKQFYYHFSDRGRPLLSIYTFFKTSFLPVTAKRESEREWRNELILLCKNTVASYIVDTFMYEIEKRDSLLRQVETYPSHAVLVRLLNVSFRE